VLRAYRLDDDDDVRSIAALRDDALEDDAVETAVRAILTDVRARGDDAVVDYGERFDGVRRASLRLDNDTWSAIADACDPDVHAALEAAADRIRAFHVPQRPQPFVLDGGRLEQRVMPLSCVGLYVPGGRAAYPSTVLMTAIPAAVAGVRRVCVATPPQAPSKAAHTVAPAIAAAARLAGVTDLFLMGGAQAIGAFAYGTAQVPRVDTICGPGNAWVASAKRQVAGRTGIDMFAGPSEVLVVEDGRGVAVAGHIALDLIAQAEHDPRAVACCVTTSEALWRALPQAVEDALLASPNPVAEAALRGQGVVALASSLDAAIAFANTWAPEHLEWLADPSQSHRVTTAGAIFVGDFSPEPVGDYFAGPNHTLPTGGTSRFASGLSTSDFMRRTHVIHWHKDDLQRHGQAIATLARSEGLVGHARAVEVRIAEAAESSSSSTASLDPALFAVPRVRAQKAYTLDAPPDAPVKLNQNEADEDLPEDLKQKIMDRFGDIDLRRYPPFAPDDVLSAIADADGWTKDGVLVGNGSNELLVALFRTVLGPGERVLRPDPCFSIYPLHLGLTGAHEDKLTLSADDDYAWPVDRLCARAAAAKVILLTSPNNPTGSVLSVADVEAVLQASTGLVVVDEAYREFCDQDFAPLLKQHRRVVLLRTFSKARGLAALRFGYVLADPSLVVEVRKVLLPYNVNALTQAAARVLLDDPTLVRDRAARTVQARGVLAMALRKKGRRVIEGGANFVLMSSTAPRRDFDALLQAGVLVRDVSAATPGFLRVSVGTDDEHAALLQALPEDLPASRAEP
jgi:histidinol dehydrogenase